MTGLPHAARPCGGPQPCPWRLDAPPGQFPAERYACLAATSRQPDEHGGHDAPPGSPMFACHKTPGGRQRACAGWLAVEGYNHLRVRLAVITGALDAAALSPGPDWPPLRSSYADLAATNGATLMLTRTGTPATIGGMSESTITRQAPEQPRRRTATYRLVETLLRQKLGQPEITLEAWVIGQRNLGIAWRPMAPRLAEAAGLDEASLPVGYEALRRWFDYLDEDEPDEPETARTAD